MTPAVERKPVSGGSEVTLAEDEHHFSIGNGALSVRIAKQSGRLVKLSYLRRNLLGQRARCSANKGGYWSVSGSPGRLSTKVSCQVIADPKTNHGDRAVISLKATYDWQPGTLPLDVDYRYTLVRGESSLFVSSIWSHAAEYPEFSMIGAGRFSLKLNPQLFDYLTIDADRRRLMPTSADWINGVEANLKEARRLTTGRYAGQVEHKYGYAAVLFDTLAYGWSSTAEKIGVWMINPSIEYIAGGATKVELTGHLDADSTAHPTLLNVWKGPHYGGSSLVLAAGEAWTKVIGPFALYCNSGGDHEALWRDALAQAECERQSWPYAWAVDRFFPGGSDRGAVAGKIILSDPLVRQSEIRNLCVGLTAPDYAVSKSPGAGEIIDWQLEGKHYQYWGRADAEGRFAIGNVRAGVYVLHAFAEGVLGELVKAPITIAAGQTNPLGEIVWTPLRLGRQLWEIGVPDRTARKFRHGDHYWHWGLYQRYPSEFPHGVNFIIGQSDWRLDWNYVQPPQVHAAGVTATTWSVSFDLPEDLHRRAVLRLAIAGSRAPRGVEVGVNGSPVGATGPLRATGVMHRDGIRGWWCERPVAFDAALLRGGRNVITLHVPAKNWTHGVLYDYLRLEHSWD
jgi:rhamnogalacturonan endolyase